LEKEDFMSTTRNYSPLAAMLILAWLALAVTTSKLLIFHAGSPYAFLPPLPLGLAVAGPILVFILWFAASPRFRQFALSLNPAALTIAQTWRVVGITFVVLASFGLLPNVFAQPAGWGDFAIGVTAPFVAFYLARPSRKLSYIAWNIAGVVDLVTAVALGVLSSPTPAGALHPAVTTDAMTVLPLSLIPTFGVPLMLILHIISIGQAMGWQIQATNGMATPTAQLSIA
jgi:hypothetical protein